MLNRREAFKAGLSVLSLGLIPGVINAAQAPSLPQKQEPIKGAGIIIYPPGGTIMPNGAEVDNRDLARSLAEQIRCGSVLCLPDERDEYGNLRWDFKIAGGDPKQVTVKRSA